MDLLRAAALTTQLCERRTDLIRLFGEATYQERTALAKARIREVMASEGALFSQRLRSPEAQEAFQAFFQKRKPDFSKF